MKIFKTNETSQVASKQSKSEGWELLKNQVLKICFPLLKSRHLSVSFMFLCPRVSTDMWTYTCPPVSIQTVFMLPLHANHACSLMHILFPACWDPSAVAALYPLHLSPLPPAYSLPRGHPCPPICDVLIQ